MQNTIKQLTTAFGVDQFLAGDCGAFAVALYDVAKEQGYNPTLVVLLRNIPVSEFSLTLDQEGNNIASQSTPTGELVQIVSHVLTEVDGVCYDATGVTTPDAWISETEDLLGPLVDEFAWDELRLAPTDSLETVRMFDEKYEFNVNQTTLYRKLRDALKEFSHGV